MELYLVRHGIAVERGSTRYLARDSERPLTSEGRRKMAANARGMRRSGIVFSYLLSSPYPRAAETAKIIAREYKAEKRLHFSHALTAEASPQKFLRPLSRLLSQWDSIMVVGHEPFLSMLAGIFLAGPDMSFLNLKKGGLMKLTGPFRPGRASLECLLTPAQLRLMSRRKS